MSEDQPLKPLISVILPTYNRGYCIIEAINSVIAQTYTYFELLIIDDGSTDNTQHLLKKIIDPRVRLILNQDNLGTSARRNQGIKESKGELIAFLDSDDYWEPTKLEEQYQFLSQSEEDVGGCVTYYDYLYPDNKKKLQKPSLSHSFFKDTLKGKVFALGSTLLFKKECIEKVGFFREDLIRCEDWEWQMRFSSHYRWGIVKRKLAVISRRYTPPLFPIEFSALKALENLTFSPQKMKKYLLSTLALKQAFLSFRHKFYLQTLGYLLKAFLKAPFITIQTFLREMCARF